MTFKILEVGVRKGESRITITKSKYIRFSPAFMEDNKLEDKKYIRVYIDKKEREILVGFEFLDEKKDKSLKLSKHEKSKGTYSSGHSLFSTLELRKSEMEKSLHFTPIEEKFEGKKLFVIKTSKKHY